jgi:hypothetical protein
MIFVRLFFRTNCFPFFEETKTIENNKGLMRVRESQIFQQSRTRWLREGDANSGYFHSSMKIRRWRNSILALRVRNRWVESVQEVHGEVMDYFRGH